MLKVKSLTLSGIGRFTEEQTIDFMQLGNLVQVDGENRNTGGSSGAGKTTLFNALDYLFGLNDIPNTVLQSRLTKDPISVSGVFDWDGQELKIVRSKKGFSVSVGGEEVGGSAKITEEKLDQIIAMPRHLFRSMLHKRQKEGGFFLQLTPKEIHEFLTDCLGLSDLRKKQEINDKKIKELTEKKISTSSLLENNKSAVRANQDAILALGSPPVKEIHQEVILGLKAKMDASQANLSVLLAQHKLEMEALELTRPQIKNIEPDFSGLNQLEEKLKGLSTRKNELKQEFANLVQQEKSRVHAISLEIYQIRNKITVLSMSVKNADKAKSEAVKLGLEVKKIRDSICPTCEQGWVTDTAKTKESELMAKISQLKVEIQAGVQAAQEIAQLEASIDPLKQQCSEKAIVENPEILQISLTEAEIANLIVQEKNQQINAASVQNIRNREALNAFSVEQNALRALQEAAMNQARGQADLDRRAFEAAAQKLRAHEDARARYESQLKQLVDNGHYYDQKVAELDKILSIADEELMLAEEAKRALKSYANVSFDDALEYIGDVASRIIRSIPNMANATIQLEGIKETKDGKIKEEVNAVISSDGEIGIPIKSLSGGERSSVDLAVDLAVIDLLENKTGKGIDIFILDEPFTGLDTISIEMALEVLKNSNLNKRLVIVDHNPEVKQMVESRLVVVREGASSVVVQQ